MQKPFPFFTRLPKTSKGAALVEYVILTGLIGVLSITSVLSLGETVDDTFSMVEGELAGVTATQTPTPPAAGGGVPPAAPGTVNVTLPLDFPADMLPPGAAPGDTINCALFENATGAENCVVPTELDDPFDAKFADVSGLLYYDIGGASGMPWRVEVEGSGPVYFAASNCSIYRDSGLEINLNRNTRVVFPCATENRFTGYMGGYDGIFPTLAFYLDGINTMEAADVLLTMYMNPNWLFDQGGSSRDVAQGTRFVFGDGTFEIEEQFYVPWFDGNNLNNFYSYIRLENRS